MYDFVTKTLSVTHVRVFNNNSGSSITVTEVGLYGRSTQAGTTCMVARDLLVSPVTVINAAQLTVTVITSMVFPADLVEQPPMNGGHTRNIMQQQNWLAWENYHTPRNRSQTPSSVHQMYAQRRRGSAAVTP